MPDLRPLAFALLALLLFPALAVADGATMPPPTLQGSYDAQAQTLYLSWQPGAPAPEGTLYSVFRDGVLVHQTPGLAYQQDLSEWSGQPQAYTVTARPPQQPETAHSAPYNLRATPTLQGQYDGGSRQLTLTWSVKAPVGSVYNVYLNGALLLQTPQQTLVEDLSLWTEGVREYVVSVVPPGGGESPASGVFRILSNVMVPQGCPIASVSIYTKPPGAEYTVYDECLPG